jgi:hypothetical protein
VLAIDPLVKLLECATQEGLLTPLRGHHAQLRISLYADDAAIFLDPTSQDDTNLRSLLELFGTTSGLSTNLEKSSFVPIRCRGLNLNQILDSFPAARATFPLKYLGLPLTLMRLRKVDCHPLLDKASSKLAHWQPAGQASHNIRTHDACQVSVVGSANLLPYIA